ncbi:hypothetical protein [Moorena sp. SIO3H5]|uniref:hypothetical protein n=1 Tax=Moorena sp. SIO3H5 TaxID=2607834 RepID=UPI0013B8692E|nr:hypothetical protein [Moorena sp. SIO3H5]NEO74602.1 hypothetical protein [Moorena sp. SIO3H5]
MATEINEMRITATTGELLEWEAFFQKIASRKLITIVQLSEPYPNRNSILHRQYYKVKFNGEI